MNHTHFVFTDLIGKILTGYYENNQKIPTERELVSIYNVSRHSVRKALTVLKSINFIDSIQGAGNYVNYVPTSSFRYNSVLTHSYENIISKCVNFTLRQANAHEQMLFGIKDTDLVWDFKRIRIIDSILTRVEHSIMPQPYFPDFNKDIVENSIYNYVSAQIPIGKIVTELSPTVTDEENSKLLFCKRKTPAMHTKNTGILENGKIFIITESIDIHYSTTIFSNFDNSLQSRR